MYRFIRSIIQEKSKIYTQPAKLIILKKRFEEINKDPIKQWGLSPIDSQNWVPTIFGENPDDD